MENMSNIIILIASLVTAITTIIVAIKKMLNKMFEPINTKIDNNEKDNLRFEILNFAGDLRNRNKKDKARVRDNFFLL